LTSDTQQGSWYVAGVTSGPREISVRFSLRFVPKAGGSDQPAPGQDAQLWQEDARIAVQEQNAIIIGPWTVSTSSLGPTLFNAGVGSQVPLLIAWARSRFHHPTSEKAGKSRRQGRARR